MVFEYGKTVGRGRESDGGDQKNQRGGDCPEEFLHGDTPFMDQIF